MPPSQLLRRATKQPRFFLPTRRKYTHPAKPPSEPSSRIRRVVNRLPRPLRPYAARLESAPVSHAAAFLVLHELTAIVPLLALFALFHYTDLHVTPVAWVTERYGSYVEEGLGKFERYFRRKGWFGLGEAGQDGTEDRTEQDKTEQNRTDQHTDQDASADAITKIQAAQGPYRVVVEVALAYAITKAMLPLRIVASLWATPWFAGILVRARSIFRR